MPNPFTKFLKSARVKNIPKGQIIIYQGDVPLEVYIVKSGLVKLYNIDEEGNEKILHLFNGGSIIPLAFFSGEHVATHWFYTALTDCELYVINYDIFWKILRQDNEVSIYMMNWFSREVHEILVRLDSLGKTNVNDKLISALKYLAVCHSDIKKNGWRRVKFPISHQLLADLMGVTRESAAISMKELSDEKLIRYPRYTVLEINFEMLI